MVSITLPSKMNEEINAMINAGYYDNKSELIREAVRLFFSKKGENRLVVAVELYRKEKITISRAAEIAGIPFENMKSILAEEGILRQGKAGKQRRTKDLEELIA